MIPSEKRNTWMQLIPKDATYEDIGFTPEGYTSTDLFWGYSWNPNVSYSTTFTKPNGLTSRSNNANQVEMYIELLNKAKYCGFSDWRTPSVTDMQTLNTSPLANNTNIKSLNREIFKNFAGIETEIKNRSQLNGGDIDPNYSPYLVNPYFWTSTRTQKNGVLGISINEYKKYLHPTETNNSDHILSDIFGGNTYFALRAVRSDRYQRIANSGIELDLSVSQWACVRDDATLGRRHWSNPIAEFSNVKFDDILKKIELFNNANTCGFNDWRLPTKKELITLKPMHSNTYFHIVDTHDYVWIKPKNDDDDEVLHLKSSSDYGLPHGSMTSRNEVKLILVRDDIFSAQKFDSNIINHNNQVIDIDILKSDFNAIIINSAASTEIEITAAFKKLSTIPEFLSIRQQSITKAELLLATALNEYSTLYTGVKTEIRNNSLISAKSEQSRIVNTLIEDINSLKIQLDELFEQYDSLKNSEGFSSEIAQATALNQGISAASSILKVLINLDDTLGAGNEINKTAIKNMITTRESEAKKLPAIGLNGGFVKITKNGEIAKSSAIYGDSWHCVKKVEISGDFTTTTFWSLLNSTTDTNIKRAAAEERLDTINTDHLCGINDWKLPTVKELLSLKIIDIITENDEAAKTIDPAVFINHETPENIDPIYWYKRDGRYAFRYATTTQKENNSVYVSLWDDTDFANARFTQKNITYLKTDMTCGSDAVTYKNKCYQDHIQERNWYDAKETCINNGQNFIAKDALTEDDYIRLAIALGLDKQKSYWLAGESGYNESYAYPLVYVNDKWLQTSSVYKTNMKSVICTGSTSPLTVPAAPTSLSQDDDANTFGWTNIAGFYDATDYQISLDNGISWKDVTANPTNVKNKNFDLGFIQVRVKAIEDKNAAGDIVKSTQGYNKVEGLCIGGSAAAELDSDCFIRYDEAKNWADANSFCESENATLISKSFSDFTTLSTDLNLDDDRKYWLLEPNSYPGYAYSLRNSSGWSPDNAYSRQSQAQPFICMQ